MTVPCCATAERLPLRRAAAIATALAGEYDTDALVLPTPTGLAFDPLLPFEVWCVLGPRIVRHARDDVVAG